LSDHPTPAEIACMAHGTLEREAIQRLVVHMLNGCQRCTRLLSKQMERAPSSLAGSPHAPAGWRRTARTAASSAAAVPAVPPAASAASPTSAASPADAAEDLYPPVYPLAAYDRPIERACATALRRFRQLERERQPKDAPGAAPAALSAGALPMPIPLTDEPLPSVATPSPVPGALPAAGRRRRRGAGKAPAVAGRRRDAVALLKVEMLLATAWDLRHSDAQKMLHIGELALSAAERLDESCHGEAVVADLRARAAADLANAHRVGNDFWKAEELMTCAVGWQRRGTGDPNLVVRIGDLLASLLVEQRRFPAADELLEKVEQHHRAANDLPMAGRTLIKRGIFAGYDGEPRRALVHLTEGLELLDHRQDRRLAAQAVHSILWNMVDCGRYRQARIYLWRSRAILLAHGGELYGLLLRWLEGRIYSGLGDLDRAERELLATRQGFELAGNTFNGALSSLDLAGVWLRQGRTADVRRLVEEMIATFRVWRNAREAVAALLILREACDRDEATLERLQTVAMLLSEVEHRPRHRPDAPGAATDRAD
jgi:hypothetical protein